MTPFRRGMSAAMVAWAFAPLLGADYVPRSGQRATAHRPALALALNEGSGELCLIQLVVRPPAYQQLFVRALLDDRAVAHHQDEMSVADGGETVCDHEAGAVGAQCRHRVLDQRFGARVH